MPAPPERGTQTVTDIDQGQAQESEHTGSEKLTYESTQAVKVAALQAAYRKREAATPRDDAPSAGQIRSLGLLDASREERNVRAASLLPGAESNLPTGAK